VSRPFDVCGPLPTGVTVLEASAGTGKTYAIAALAARYIADGVPLDQLLLVTFTRMATGELRERVRDRLVSVEEALSRPDPGERDPVVRLLADGPPELVEQRRHNLSRARADFDAATIATTHGFCQEVLAGLGVAGDVERDFEFIEDDTDLREQVVDDLYVRRFHREEQHPISRDEAGRIAKVAVENPVAPIEPSGVADSLPAMRARLAQAVRDELRLRKERAGLMTYDDLLTKLDETLRGPAGEIALRRLRRRYRVVLVDEFQDTDPIQWSILRRAFAEGDSTLVLIGDPKQAIYAFRGADVYAYLDAAGEASDRPTLETNRRSDQGLIDAYDALFGVAQLGHEGIVYRPVHATAANQAPRLPGTPLRIRVVHRDEPSLELTARGYATSGSAREHVADDLAGDLVRLLNARPEIERRAEDGSTLERFELRPGHVAVLVQTNRTAALIRDALDAAGVPAVINGAGSVFGTDPARQWLRLLEALERPTSSLRAHAAALTPFLGWTAEQVATADDADWEAVHTRLHEWAAVLRLRGVASLAETITQAEGLPERILARADGERALTDVRHVAELLHAAATSEQLGTTALVGWLRRRIAEAGQDTGDEDRSRRLESDEEAVQVLTIHRSKGLEFPVVYYPYLWEPSYIPSGMPVVFHDPEAGDRRTIDVGLEGADFERHKRQELIEQRGEDLRLAYVALTRAQHQAVVWWAATWNCRDSALGRLLFAREADGTVPAVARNTPSDAAAWTRFEALSDDAPECIAVERSTLRPPETWAGQRREPAELSAARFDRDLDERWRRTSFSDISAGAYEARVGSEPEETSVTDEPEGPASAPAAGELPLAAMPVGVEVGTFVHRMLEATDFAAPDLDAELAAAMAAVQARRPVDLGDPGRVVAGLRAAIETPLLDGLRLRDLGRADRLDELDFEFPLVGGDRPRGRLDLDAVAAVLRAHGDPLGYADRLDDPALRRSVRGYVTGSIDLVARARDRFAVIDYKTNWLGAPGRELTAGDYRPEALAAEMVSGHYGLQALLYTVALHRYLRWRLVGYDPDRHLAGVLYLFLRGMTGTAAGVFSWRPSGELVTALSDVLDGESAGADSLASSLREHRDSGAA
jgi:exodeoxyribonuclease V beta subunit